MPRAGWSGSAPSREKPFRADGYAMTVNVEPGEYGLLVWCGTTDKGSFSIPETTVGNELTCTLGREHDAGNEAFVAEDLDRLFHGWLPEQTFGETEGTYTYTVPLVKNTNNVRVVLQHLSGEAMDKDRFVFTITDTNGSMDWDNSLRPDEPVTTHGIPTPGKRAWPPCPTGTPTARTPFSARPSPS